MPLTLVTGPANSAKAGFVLDAWRGALDADPLLVVPTYADVLHYQRELAGEGSVLGGAVLVFDRLVGEVARRAGYAQPRVGALQRRLLLAESIAALPLGELAESARSRGFVTAA